MKSLENLGVSGYSQKDVLQKEGIVMSAAMEREAEGVLENLLEREENRFLTEIEQNRKALDGFASAVEALAFALSRIEERQRRTFRFAFTNEIPGVKIEGVSFDGLKRNIDTVLEHAEEIGRGGDGFVVIDKSEVRGLPPEICYKFTIQEATPRGRNSIEVETELQEKFYRAAGRLPNSKIGVPAPFYAVEIGINKVIAMEKLHARSVDDILHGAGSLPEGFDVDIFCDELAAFLDHVHQQGLYHRDMHFGNIMITQRKDLVSQGFWGYVIDFGLSVEDQTGLEPYKKQVAGDTFTYSRDHDIIISLRQSLKKTLKDKTF